MAYPPNNRCRNCKAFISSEHDLCLPCHKSINERTAEKIKEALDAAGSLAVACLRVDGVFVYVDERGYTLAAKHDPFHEVSFENVGDMIDYVKQRRSAA